jgi:hypothetical protein
MDTWGHKMLGVVELVATAAAVGFGLAPDALTRLMAEGPHLLAPTGSDLARNGQLGTVLAGAGEGARGRAGPGRGRGWARRGAEMGARP